MSQKLQTQNRRASRSLGDVIRERVFLFLRQFKPARERVTLGEYNDHVEREHVVRYQFARQFCQGKSVADIACGTGYGTKILTEVAASVVGFDKESLCGNPIVDLETQCWKGSYDVIVSFETLEHLENPQFFLDNVHKTAKLLVVSSPIGEFRGYNPHHKQVWTFPEFKELVEKTFECRYYYQAGEQIHSNAQAEIKFVIAVCSPKPA